MIFCEVRYPCQNYYPENDMTPRIENREKQAEILHYNVTTIY